MNQLGFFDAAPAPARPAPPPRRLPPAAPAPSPPVRPEPPKPSPAPALAPTEARGPPDPRICFGKLPTSWCSAFRPAAGHVCACCGYARFWTDNKPGWLCATCYPPRPGSVISEMVDTSQPSVNPEGDMKWPQT